MQTQNMLNNTNVSNPILLSNAFAADLWWSSSAILISKNMVAKRAQRAATSENTCK